MTDIGAAAMEPLLDPQATAKFLNVSISWLAKARVEGGGPEFVKIGHSVRYAKSSLLKFVKVHTRTSTAAE
jgi:hypothetical protein